MESEIRNSTFHAPKIFACTHESSWYRKRILQIFYHKSFKNFKFHKPRENREWKKNIENAGWVQSMRQKQITKKERKRKYLHSRSLSPHVRNVYFFFLEWSSFLFGFTYIYRRLAQLRVNRNRLQRRREGMKRGRF